MNALTQQIQAEFSRRRLHYRRDVIPGGLGDKASPQDFDREQVAKGIRVEMEHTSDPKVALEIVLDHLSETPTYYDELGKLKLSRLLSAEFAKRRHVYGKEFVESDHPRDGEGKFVANSVPEFESYSDALKWIDEQSAKATSRNEFLSSNEYKAAYPAIQRAHQSERKSYADSASKAMEDAAVKDGDRVYFDYVSPFGVATEYTGTLKLRNGVPRVQLDEGQKTISGAKSAIWHKGWKKSNK